MYTFICIARDSFDAFLHISGYDTVPTSVVAILRAKNADVAIARGVELADMGCQALEVTLDSHEFPRILATLVNTIGDRCMYCACSYPFITVQYMKIHSLDLPAYSPNYLCNVGWASAP